MFGSREPQTVFTPREVDAAEELVLQALARVYGKLPKDALREESLDGEAADLLGMVREEILKAHAEREDASRGWLAWRKDPLRRLPFLLTAKNLDGRTSTPSKKLWTVTGQQIENDERFQLFSEDKVLVVEEYQEVRIPRTGYQTGIRLVDSVQRGPNGTIQPLFLVEMHGHNYQGFIGTSPEGLYRFGLTYSRNSDAVVQIERLENTLKPVFEIHQGYIKKNN